MNTAAIKLSPAEELAEAMRESMVPDMLKTIRWTKHLALFIVLAVMTVSYQHMRHFFVSKDADWLGATLLPIIVDASILFMVRVISTMAMDKLPKRLAMSALVIPITASAWINFGASPNATIGWVYVVVIGLVAVVETIKALIKPNPEEMKAAEDKMAVAPQIDVAEIARQQAIAEAAARQAAIEAAEAERRSESAKKAAATRKEREQREADEKAAKAEQRRLNREAKKLEALAPSSPGHPVVILSAADQLKLAEMDFPTH